MKCKSICNINSWSQTICHRLIFIYLLLRYDKLIIDDQVYIYNDSEKRIERLPFSVYSTASSGTVPPTNISHSKSHSDIYATSNQESRDEAAQGLDHQHQNSQHPLRYVTVNKLTVFVGLMSLKVLGLIRKKDERSQYSFK